MKLNYMLAQIKGIGPRDQIESVLAVQMAATHSALMAAANTLNRVKLIPQIDSAERRFNKLARTFTTQIEALKRYRRNQAPRCHATSKRNGKACRSPAVKGKAVCRMHGARAGAPKGNHNALKHGLYTARAIGENRVIAALIKRSWQTVELV